jgi:hypothetical protein
MRAEHLKVWRAEAYPAKEGRVENQANWSPFIELV